MTVNLTDQMVNDIIAHSEKMEKACVDLILQNLEFYNQFMELSGADGTAWAARQMKGNVRLELQEKRDAVNLHIRRIKKILKPYGEDEDVTESNTDNVLPEQKQSDS